MQEFLSMSQTVEEMLQMLKDYLVSDFKETFVPMTGMHLEC